MATKPKPTVKKAAPKARAKPAAGVSRGTGAKTAKVPKSNQPAAPDVPRETTKRKPGRPTAFSEEIAKSDKMRDLVDRGATDEEIAEEFGVTPRTIYNWKHTRPEFFQSLKAGKDGADDRVERSLYQKAVGYHYTEKQAIKVKTGPNTEEVVLVDVQRFQPPDPTSMIFWLKNRRKEQWRDKVDNVHSNPDGSPLDLSLRVSFVAPAKK